MKKEILNIFKEDLIIKISFLFMLVFPIILLLGSALINTSIVIMNIFFLIHIYNEKKFRVFNNNIFYLLCALWIFLIINTLLNEDFIRNYERSFGFIRFVLLIFSFSYFFSYKDSKFKKIIFNFWTIVFIIVSLDLIFEFIFGFNTFGFKSNFHGRLAGFMGDELKIGHWYLCFSLIILSTNFKNSNRFYFLLFLSISISFLIGERANFIRLFLAITSLLLITRYLSFKNLAVLCAAIAIIFLISDNTADNTDSGGKQAYKYRWTDQIATTFKHNTLKGFNNSNSYTPMYLTAYNIFLENKFLGVGVGSYLEKSHEKYRKIKIINGYILLPNTHPHQLHFEILATIGLPGYIFIFFFFLYFLSRSFKFYLKTGNITNLTSFLFIFVYLLPVLPTGSFFTTYGAAMFWLNFSLMNLGNFKNNNY